MKLRLLGGLFVLAGISALAGSLEWPQWGGPTRNFNSDAKGLANSWPPDGPRRLWSRELGEGYSGIAVEGGALYTMVRRGSQEGVVAIDANTGKTLWEHNYDASFLGNMQMENGPGPHATPLVVGNSVFTTGVTGKFFSLDKKTGKVNWSRDLYREFDGQRMGRGYSCSPIAYKNWVILTIGGRGQAVMAFDQKDGTVAWKNATFDNANSSPILIHFEGQDQLVIFTANDVLGVDANNGAPLWSIPHKTDWGLNISTPVWGEGNLLFVSSAYSGGSRAIKLHKVAGRITATELWFTNRLRVHHTNAIRLGDYVYGSSGDFGPAFLTAVNIHTGKEAWRDRSFAKASLVYADGKFIILDEDGNLALATASPEGLKVHSRVPLLKHNAWTAPSLVGTKLYVRDRRTLVALDLS